MQYRMLNQTLMSNFSITSHRKLKENVYCYRARFVLSEHILTVEISAQSRELTIGNEPRTRFLLNRMANP